MQNKIIIFLIIIFILLYLPACSGNRNNQNSRRDSGSVTIDKTVELALIIASISPLDQETNNTINRSTPYFDKVKTHFEPYYDHPVFDSLGQQFNLPRLAGNAADYEITANGDIIQQDSSGSLWKDDKYNHFKNFRHLIQDFALKSDFQKFYVANNPLYRELIHATNSLINQDEMVNWLQTNFTAHAKPVKIFISPLLSGLHWTTLYKPEQRIWISPPNLEKTEDWSGLEKMQYRRLFFTELDHDFVNPVTEKYLDKVNNGFTDLSYWGNDKSKGYNTPALKFNEYMTWSVFMLFAYDNLNESDFASLSRNIIDFMVDRRGFIQFEAFAAETVRRYKSGSKTAEQIQLEMIRWSQEVSK